MLSRGISSYAHDDVLDMLATALRIVEKKALRIVKRNGREPSVVEASRVKCLGC
jgi:hypothetical protein